MRTRIQLLLAVLAVLVAASAAAADQKSHRKAAEELLKVLNMDKQLQSAIDQTLDLQIKANPGIAEYRDVMKKFFSKHMSWDSLKEDIITIYTDAFTEEELNEITKFYKTPVGKKLVEKNPELMGKGMQLGVKRVQENQGELRQMLEDARDKKQPPR
jgi:hypothetical protein